MIDATADLDREIDLRESESILKSETSLQGMGQSSRDVVHRHLEVPTGWEAAGRLQRALEDAESAGGARWTLRNLLALQKPETVVTAGALPGDVDSTDDFLRTLWKPEPAVPSPVAPEYADPIAASIVARSILLVLASRARVDPDHEPSPVGHVDRKEALLQLHGSALIDALQNIPISPGSSRSPGKIRGGQRGERGEGMREGAGR